MYILVGLGNPGAEYAGTRHNVGRMALDYFLGAFHFPHPVRKREYNAYISEGMLEEHEVVALYPETYMNQSGGPVGKVIPALAKPETLVVLHDDIDLPFGVVHVSKGRGSGGHNGIKSIEKSIGSKDFVRIRIGVAPKNIFGVVRKPKGERVADFVLGSFTRKEERELSHIVKHASEVCACVVRDGVDRAMNQYN